MTVETRNRSDNDQSPRSIPGKYLRPCEAAEFTGLSESTLAKLRMRGNRAAGPSFIKMGGAVIYRRADLDDWMNQHVVGGL